MSTVELTPENEDVSVEVELKRVADALGEQYILGDDVDEPQFAYLAAIALETNDSHYSIQDTLMEFIRNSRSLDRVDVEDCNEIERLLNQ